MKKRIIIFFILLCITGFNRTYAQDTDGDGIVNTSDLDDDNDGILDVDEGCGNIVSSEERGTFGTTTVNRNLSTNPGPGYTFKSGQLVNAGDYAVISNAAPQPHPSPALWNYNGHTTNTATDAYLAVNGSTSVGVFFRQSVRLVAGVTYTYSFWHASASNTSLADGYNIRIRIMNSSGTTQLASTTTGQRNLNIWSQTSLSFTPTITGDYNILLQNESTGFTGNDFAIDDIAFISPCGTLDTDGDGTPDYLDLDSDNDGCFDALEGDENVTRAGLNLDGSINGSINSNGVPNFVNAGGGADIGGDTGQGTGASANAAISTACADMDFDGTPNTSDLDDDNDGIPDNAECLGNDIVTNGTFTGGLSGWTADAGWAGTTNAEISADNVANRNLSQTITGLANTNSSIPLKLTLSALDGNSSGGSTASLQILLNGTLYATVNNGTARSTGANNVTITLASGATSTFTPFSTANTSSQTFTLNIPNASIPNTASLVFRAATALDDWSLDDISILAFTCDTDGDGILNHIDLDSDNDGCFDALEGDENVGNLQLNGDGSISAATTGGTNAVGVPNLVNSGGAADTGSDTGQGIGSSANAGISTCTDTDNDGIANITDLDDDNDGILDTVENTCTLPSTSGTSAQPHLGWDVNFTPLPGGLEINQLSPDVITANSTVSFGSGISVVNQNSNWQISNVNSTTAAQAKANNDYIQVTIPMAATNSNRVLELKEWTTFGGQNFPVQNLHIEVADNVAFTGSTVLFTGANTNGPGFQKYPFAGNYRLQKGVVYYVRFYIYGSAATVNMDSFGLGAQCFTDTDGDGTPNLEDLDSDGDGCSDAIEGDENVTPTQLNADGSINISANGGVNRGVPNLVNSGGAADTGGDQGQGAGYAYLLGINACKDFDNDGLSDVDDLDDDNDGILDTVENTCTLPSTANNTIDPHLRWDVNNTPFPGKLETNQLSPDVITANSTVSFGSGLPGSQKTSLYWEIRNVNSTTAAQAKANNDYIQVTIPMAATSNRVLELKEWVTDDTVPTAVQNISVEIADNAAFTGSTVLYSGINTNGPNFQKYPLGGNYRLQKGTVYYVRVYIYGSAATVNMDSFGFNAQCFTDTDGDGIPDLEDLDSDGDGCFDAIEGDENVAETQLNADGSINISANGGINATG
ncbi:beta strand repeat-containing protein, partial [Chryseobacterium populi]